MMCLSIQQPWAWKIFHGKDVENRTWYTDYRGPLLIHASKSLLRMDDSLYFPDGYIFPRASELVFGAVIGRVQLVDCVEFKRMNGAKVWAEGPWCWLLENPVLFGTPVPFRGQPKLFEVPMEVLS